MRDPSSRLLKFRLQLEEYNFVIEYIQGVKNSAADALSRIIINSDELKQLNERVLNVMTRAQARIMHESLDREKQNSSNLLIIIFRTQGLINQELWR